MIDLRQAIEAELVQRFTLGRRREIFVWGAGGAGRAAAAVLAKRGVSYAGFIDRDPAKTGTSIEGHTVFLPDVVTNRRPRPRVLIASIHHREISDELRSLGFRAERDFEVFPSVDEPLLLAPGGASLYAVWHIQWSESAGLAERPAANGPPVRAIPIASTGAWSSFRLALGRMPADNDAWVVLYDRQVRRMNWIWRRDGVPAVGTQAALAVYDWPAPRPERRREPFLLRALAQAALLSGPVLCRAGVLRQYLQRKAGSAFSLDLLKAWMTDHFALTGGFAGVCRVRGTPSTRGRVPATARASAPALVQFSLEVAQTGFPVFAPDEVTSFLPSWIDARLDPESGFEYLRIRRSANRPPLKLRFLAHSRGNFFFQEMREFLAANWRRAGAKVQLGDERDAPGDGTWRNVIIAPHEFFLLKDRNPAWDSAQNLVLLNTEQPQTRWFASCLPRLLSSPLVFDLNWQTAVMLRMLGVNAHFLPLGWDERHAASLPRAHVRDRPPLFGMSPEERRLPKTDNWADRPIDVLFVGTLSPRRSRIFARAARELARYRCFLHLPPIVSPIVTGSVDSIDARDMTDLCRRAKIVLNIHREELAYCEWHRVIFQAMRQGALVVSEPMMRVPGFTPGREFIAAKAGQIPQVIARVLGAQAGARQAAGIAARGRDAFRRQFPAEKIARCTLELF